MKRAIPEIFYGKPKWIGILEDVVVDRRVILKWITYIYIYIQGLSKSFERFKFGIFYVLIAKIR